MVTNEIVEITLSPKNGEREILDKFNLEIECGSIIRLKTVGISASIFIPYPNQFFDTPETEFLEYSLDAGDEVTLPPIRLDLDKGTVKEYQVFDSTNSHFAWKVASSPPRIVIR